MSQLPDLFSRARDDLGALGSRVRADRLDRDMSQESYARLLTVAAGPTVDVPTLSRIERGQMVPEPYVGQAITQLLSHYTPLQTPTPARNSDPATSHQNTPTANTEVHKGILSILKHYPDGLAHFEIIEYYRKRQGVYEDAYPDATDQRIRTATKELVIAGRVEMGEETHTNNRGRKCHTWRQSSPSKT